MAAPALLGAVLLGLVALDLVLGGQGLSQPLLGGSAWDGERFYGLGNGYFAFALAAVMLVAGFAPLSAVATAALAAALGVVDGLPRLGADVGGALTSMLTAAAALVVLAPGRPRARRVVLLAGLALAAAVAVALGAGLGGPVSHAGRFADRLQQGPADAAGVVVDQLARNLRLLANSPFAWVGPLQVLLAGLIALRPPPPLRDLPDWTRRVLGLGAFGSALLILLNDTGVTATAGSGLFLLAIPAWAWLDQHRAAGQPAGQPRPRPGGGAPLRRSPLRPGAVPCRRRRWPGRGRRPGAGGRRRRPGCRRRPPQATVGAATAEPTANAPSLRLAAVVKIWPRRAGGDHRCRVAKVAANDGPSATPASATRTRATGNDGASGQARMARPNRPRPASTTRCGGQGAVGRAAARAPAIAPASRAAHR